MCLIDDQGIVLLQITVSLRFSQQDAVRHELDVGCLLDLFHEPHLIAHPLTQFRAHLLSYSARHRCRC